MNLRSDRRVGVRQQLHLWLKCCRRQDRRRYRQLDKIGSEMRSFRIALANIPFPASPEESVSSATHAIAQASTERAEIICFPECFVPGYRCLGKKVPPPDPLFLERAWSAIASAAASAGLAVILGTE